MDRCNWMLRQANSGRCPTRKSPNSGRPSGREELLPNSFRIVDNIELHDIAGHKRECMSNFDFFVPPHIRSMGRYVPGKTVRQAEAESGVRSIKLASNENPFGPSPLAVEAIQCAATEMNWYPDADSAELRAAIAERHGVPADHVLLAAGSS